MSIEEIAKAWEPTEENFKRALGVLEYNVGMMGYPGPAVGSLAWAEAVVVRYLRSRGEGA